MVTFGAVLLALMLLGMRLHDYRRAARVFNGWRAILSPAAAHALEWLQETVNDHRFGVALCTAAVDARCTERLRTGVRAVEAFAPNLREGLAAMRDVARNIDVLAGLPAVSPGAWTSGQLRGLAGLAALTHAVLVTGAERLSLRVWLLTRALALSLRWLRGAAAPTEGPRWREVRAALADLRVVGDQAELTYDHVFRALDTRGAFSSAHR